MPELRGQFALVDGRGEGVRVQEVAQPMHLLHVALDALLEWQATTEEELERWAHVLREEVLPQKVEEHRARLRQVGESMLREPAAEGS
jgi:hypothetical protein